MVSEVKYQTCGLETRRWAAKTSDHYVVRGKGEEPGGGCRRGRRNSWKFKKSQKASFGAECGQKGEKEGRINRDYEETACEKKGKEREPPLGGRRA